jgi:hypothetical protein
MIEWASTQTMMNLFEEMGYSPAYRYTNEIDFKDPDKLFLRSIGTQGLTGGTGPQWLVLDREFSDRTVFLEFFENRGWQPKRRMFSPFGPRAGMNEADSAGNPISTVWQITEDLVAPTIHVWDSSDKGQPLDEIANAELFAEVGRDKNPRVYIWDGFVAFFPDGYSNMVLLEFYDDPVIGDNKSMHGKVHYGEKAFQKWKEMRTYLPEIGNPDSINRWKI